MSRKLAGIAMILVLVLIAPLLPACTHATPATAFTAVIPAVFQSGVTQNVSIALFSGDSAASGNVNVSLLKDEKALTEGQALIKGNGQIELKIPDLPEGEYTLLVKGDSFQDQAKVKVQKSQLIFIETDKPIYKPGQTIHIRAITLDSGLMPLSEKVTVDVLDARGIKIFRTESSSDEYGMAEIDLPISAEPNLGTWKISASTARSNTQLDVKVEEYVLPKYEVKVDLPREWYLVNEPIKGKVSATYSFGRPVKGALQIIATKYAGTWQDYAKISLEIEGEADFTIPPAKYVAGVPAAQGNGNVKLQFVVTETSTGYQETNDTLLSVSQSSTNLQIIPSGLTFKPGLPYSLLIVSETPDNKLVDSDVQVHVAYLDKDYKEIKNLDRQEKTVKGKLLLEINPPQDSIALTVSCSVQNASASKTIEAAYSPSGNFIHLEQTSEGIPIAGENLKFYVFSTGEATNFYYEVISRGRLVFADYTRENEIILKTTPAMAPSARLLVYQILPNAEVAADYLPFEVTAQYPQNISLNIASSEVKPGDKIDINVQTEGQSEVGLAAVDKSVFILAENRVNLQQIFDQLESLYMNPQAELHTVSIYDGIQNRGAKEVFQAAGVIVLSNKNVPEGKKYDPPVQWGQMGGRNGLGAEKGALPPMMSLDAQVVQAPVASHGSSQDSGLAEIQRIRQFFPETWIWDKIETDAAGKATFKVTVPDTITTWMMRAVAVSKSKGLGIVENQLKVFQPFFLSVDLPYSAIRGEEFPVSVAIYNYLDQPQSVVVQIEKEDWFDLLDDVQKTVEIKANDIGSVKFKIKPVKLGNASEIKVTARSKQSADAVVKTLIIEAEGVAKEIVDNVTLSEGNNKQLSTVISGPAVEGSSRAYFAVTSSYLAQTINGLESLIQMPFGCGEQNMIIFAPDVYITKYLQSSGQLKPEIMAKAEKLMLTGYQRELTYRRNDGSFSAFGQSDKEGSLWLTAFVLKCFSEAKGLIYIDDQILDSARAWIVSHQKTDGSFDAVGFVHHTDMLGGLKGKTALTAYIATALIQAGDKSASNSAIDYLEKQLDQTDDAYTVALVAYALELAGSERKEAAHDKLMLLAKNDENGLYWGDNAFVQSDSEVPAPGMKMMPVRPVIQTSAIEATAYATLALTQNGDTLNAASGARWLVSKRNAYGGFGSTQDTVMALKALIEYSGSSRADVDLTVRIEAGGSTQQIKITSQNFDVLQIVEVPVNSELKISASGKGEAIGQVVRRFNIPEAGQQKSDVLKINVNYDADEVAVSDEVKVAVDLSFNPPDKIEAGMLVVDIAVPTGFEAVKESIEKAVSSNKKFKRYDISGRKVIFYIENMLPGDSLNFEFRVKALYPVKAKGAASQAYSYYRPEVTAEALGSDITILEP
jgi:CD109 antigen